MIENAGKLTHEFIVLKTDVAEDALPLDAKKGAVNESGDGVDVVGEGKLDLAGGRCHARLR